MILRWDLHKPRFLDGVRTSDASKWKLLGIAEIYLCVEALRNQTLFSIEHLV